MNKTMVKLSFKGVDHTDSVVGIVRMDLEDPTKKLIGICGFAEIPNDKSFILYNDNLKNFFFYGNRNQIQENYFNNDVLERVLAPYKVKADEDAPYEPHFCIPFSKLELSRERTQMLEQVLSGFGYYAEKIVNKMKRFPTPMDNRHLGKVFENFPEGLCRLACKQGLYYVSSCQHNVDLDRAENPYSIDFQSKSTLLGCYQDLLGKDLK